MPDATEVVRKITSSILTNYHNQGEGCDGRVQFVEVKRKLSKYQRFVGSEKRVRGFICTHCDMQWDEKGAIEKDDYRYRTLQSLTFSA